MEAGRLMRLLQYSRQEAVVAVETVRNDHILDTLRVVLAKLAYCLDVG